MRPEATSVWGFKLLEYDLRTIWVRLSASSEISRLRLRLFGDHQNCKKQKKSVFGDDQNRNKKKLFSARVSELARLESAAALAVCSSVAALLQLCCSSVAALQSRVSELARIKRLESVAALAVCSSVAALLQLCCSSVAALLQLCCSSAESRQRARSNFDDLRFPICCKIW